MRTIFQWFTPCVLSRPTTFINRPLLSLKMKRVFLDTSFLLVPGQFGIDIIEEIKRIADFPYELVAVDKVWGELDAIIEVQGGNAAVAARFAKKILDNEKVRKIETTETFKNVDRLILDNVDAKHDLVATQDKALKAKLRGIGIRIIEMRQKSRLTID